MASGTFRGTIIVFCQTSPIQIQCATHPTRRTVHSKISVKSIVCGICTGWNLDMPTGPCKLVPNTKTMVVVDRENAWWVTKPTNLHPIFIGTCHNWAINGNGQCIITTNTFVSQKKTKVFHRIIVSNDYNVVVLLNFWTEESDADTGIHGTSREIVIIFFHTIQCVTGST